MQGVACLTLVNYLVIFDTRLLCLFPASRKKANKTQVHQVHVWPVLAVGGCVSSFCKTSYMMHRSCKPWNHGKEIPFCHVLLQQRERDLISFARFSNHSWWLQHLSEVDIWIKIQVCKISKRTLLFLRRLPWVTLMTDDTVTELMNARCHVHVRKLLPHQCRSLHYVSNEPLSFQMGQYSGYATTNCKFVYIRQ